jgi:hypothetical protein
MAGVRVMQKWLSGAIAGACGLLAKAQVDSCHQSAPSSIVTTPKILVYTPIKEGKRFDDHRQ